MTRITVDGTSYEVDGESNLLEACLSHKLDLPYFCWHPALGSVGACRQCAVKVFKNERDKQGKLAMACMTPAKDGTLLSIRDPEAAEFRASVIGWLMENHPHDCPVCDEGGECHLQDMTVMTGHTIRNDRFPKRTFRNQNLGPFVTHEMNRCIQCYRCVRFYRDYAGGRDFNAFGSQERMYFGRFEDGPLESPFSGNLVEVCPTGVFTDKTLARHYTRKWDLQTAPSVCAHCGIGCNTSPGARYGRLRRIQNRFHRQINGHFLCDRGRFGYEFTNTESRIEVSSARASGSTAEARNPPRELVAQAARWIREGGGAIGIGSPRASLESNFALRTLVGRARFFSGIPARELALLHLLLSILRSGPVPSASVLDLEQADAAIILGEDVMNTAPRMALALHQSIRQAPLEIRHALGIPRWDDQALRTAVQDRKGPLYILSPGRTALDPDATRTHHASPEDLARFGFAIARGLGAPIPDVEGLGSAEQALAQEIAGALSSAKRPVVVTGLGLRDGSLLAAAADIAWALSSRNTATRIAAAVPESNSMGAALLGGRPLEEAFQMLRDRQADTVVILENDLYRRAEPQDVDRALTAARHILAIDYLRHSTLARAELVLASTPLSESTGTLVNYEGRAQRFFQVLPPAGDSSEGWRWLSLLLEEIRPSHDTWSTVDDVIRTMEAEEARLRGLGAAAPRSDFRMLGQRIPREPSRFSGRTAITASKTVHEPAPPEDLDAPLAFSMEGFAGHPPAALVGSFWAPGWNSIQSLHKYQNEVEGTLVGGPAGVRLIESGPAGAPPYFTALPAPFQASPGEFWMIPSDHVFGSEELSARAPGILERTPRAAVIIQSEDARTVGIRPGESVDLRVGARRLVLPVELREDWPRGIAGFPAGLPDVAGIELPAWGRMEKMP